jgi:hypothetical protein
MFGLLNFKWKIGNYKIKGGAVTQFPFLFEEIIRALLAYVTVNTEY